MSEERSIGRPTVITEEVAEAIFARIEAGESVSGICKSDGFPSSRTLYRRVESDEGFRARFNWSLMVRSELWAEEIVTISDSVKGSTSMEAINAAKLMVDARKWIVSRLLAKKYGDRASEVNVTSTVNNHFVITEEEQRELQEITRRLWVEQHGNDSDKKRLLGGED
jgi:Bacteriophage Sf6, terminase small subunit-like